MILDGKIVAADIKQRLKQEIDTAVASGLRQPHLVIISVGDDPASTVYVVSHLTFPADEDTFWVRNSIEGYAGSPDVDGIMIQLPLPDGWNERELIDMIPPSKDVDGLTTTNIGHLRSGQKCLKPCTAAGIIDLCKYYNIDLDGKDVTSIGRSNIVGKPLADMRMAEGATVTQCHTHTSDLMFHTLTADIIISAVGKPKLITEKMIKCGAIVIDVGINRDENGKLCGDVDYENVWAVAEHITPVPGGVGPMTVAELMSNTVDSWRKRI